MALQYTPVLLSLTTGKQSASPLVLYAGAWLFFSSAQVCTWSLVLLSCLLWIRHSQPVKH